MIRSDKGMVEIKGRLDGIMAEATMILLQLTKEDRKIILGQILSTYYLERNNESALEALKEYREDVEYTAKLIGGYDGN